jgi:hypothetical protein
MTKEENLIYIQQLRNFKINSILNFLNYRFPFLNSFDYNYFLFNFEKKMTELFYVVFNIDNTHSTYNIKSQEDKQKIINSLSLEAINLMRNLYIISEEDIKLKNINEMQATIINSYLILNLNSFLYLYKIKHQNNSEIGNSLNLISKNFNAYEGTELTKNFMTTVGKNMIETFNYYYIHSYKKTKEFIDKNKDKKEELTNKMISCIKKTNENYITNYIQSIVRLYFEFEAADNLLDFFKLFLKTFLENPENNIGTSIAKAASIQDLIHLLINNAHLGAAELSLYFNKINKDTMKFDYNQKALCEFGLFLKNFPIIDFEITRNNLEDMFKNNKLFLNEDTNQLDSDSIKEMPFPSSIPEHNQNFDSNNVYILPTPILEILKKIYNYNFYFLLKFSPHLNKKMLNVKDTIKQEQDLEWGLQNLYNLKQLALNSLNFDLETEEMKKNLSFCEMNMNNILNFFNFRNNFSYMIFDCVEKKSCNLSNYSEKRNKNYKHGS